MRAVADGGTGMAQAFDLRIAEVNAVRQPTAAAEPADFFEVVERPHAKVRATEVVLILGFTKVRVQAHVQPFGQFGCLAQQPAADRERRARRQCHLDHGAGSLLVVRGNHPLTVGEDGVSCLHQCVWRQAAVFFG